MRKFYGFFVCALVCAGAIYSIHHFSKPPVLSDERVTLKNEEEEEENEGYDGPDLRDQLEFDKTKDPALGYVPYNRLAAAIDYTENLKKAASANKMQALLWIERGPIYDSTGPSNGNTRAGNGYTSGRIRAVLVDTLNDPTGNTVITGGVAGGIWRCTNFLSAVPNWVAINDYFDNLAISSICQDPSRPQTMYFATGEATSNADAVYGRGIWKSTNGGLSWTLLSSTTNFIRNFKIACDAAGNVYVAARITTTPAAQPAGLLRSKDGGATWTNISPSSLTNTSCTDIEISSTGKLHAAFGYLGTTVSHRYTTDPANVSSAAGWLSSTGIRSSATATAAVRMELACVADTLYAMTVNTSYNIDSCYKSTDGGATWTKTNSAAYTTGLGSGQGWYSMTLAINPQNTNEIMAGGLDAYRSTNSGATITRQTFWVTTAPYVHADHHFMQWWTRSGESRILIGCDGGLFLSRDAGVNWSDKNRNLAIKQFYSCAIHPQAGSDYLLAGAQDNGSHQLKNPGLSYSIEVTGGDGCYVHINQQDPNVQFASYVYNQYRRSTNGGQSWTSVNFSSSAGLFVNPFDYDDGQNIMYASFGANAFLRWTAANTSTSATSITATEMAGGAPAALKVSPYTPNRLFIGTTNGRLIRVDNANTITTATTTGNITDIRGTAFSSGNLNCVNVGTSDNTLVAVFSNYGVTNVFYSTNGGSSWTGIDGNLPDMPVRWAAFKPGSNTELFLGTEAGVYYTDNINGASTVWTPDTNFPTVRVDMLKIRQSDNTIVAGTHGRGLFTAVIPTTSLPEIKFITPSTDVTEAADVANGCRPYKEYTVNVGIVNPPTGDATVTYSVQAGSTATEGVDFDFTTNGDFTNPSKTHVFVSGQVVQKSIKIRVYDDAEVEPKETFTIGFAITGSTNAIAGSPRTHVVTINDNDEAPYTPGTVTASFGVNNTALTQPFRGQFSDSRTQILYLASELRAGGLRAGNVTSLGFNVTSKTSTAPYNNFNIKLKNTTSTVANGGAFETGAVQAYGPVNYSTVAGANNFTLTTPFYWDGVSNLLIDICYDNVTGTGTDNVAGTAGLPMCHFERVDNAAGCSLATATFVFSGGARPDMTFTVNTTGTLVASSLNSTQTSYLTSNNDLYYYNAAGELMARIRNLSTHNYGCTQVSIDRAGTGATEFWNTNKANYLMDKTFRVVPTTNNATGKYEVTFYYTAAEKTGWETATGQSWNNIQLVKVPSAIKNVTPQTPQPDGPGTVQIVTPTRGTFASYYTLTYQFENGFSGFGAGIPGRINEVLTLTGALNNDHIDLTWTTSAEMGTTQFEVQKSYDKVNFRTIAIVPAAGTKFTPSTYTLVDNDMTSEFNYYRVYMRHNDGFVLVSETILVRNNNIKQQMFVLTNPFNNVIRVRFARSPRSSVVFSLYDAAGKLVLRNTETGGSLVYYNNKGIGPIANGVYMLDAYTEGVHYTARLLKQ